MKMTRIEDCDSCPHQIDSVKYNGEYHCTYYDERIISTQYKLTQCYVIGVVTIEEQR